MSDQVAHESVEYIFVNCYLIFHYYTKQYYSNRWQIAPAAFLLQNRLSSRRQNDSRR